MSWIDGLRHRLRAIVDPRGYERDMQDEMAFHLDLETMHEGDPYRAKRKFGNRTYWQEETRRMTWLGAMDGLVQDVRYSWRSLARMPGLALMIVVTLALGVGVNAATFTLLDQLYLRPPSGVQNASGLRRIWFVGSGINSEDGKPTPYQSGAWAMYEAVAHASGDPRRVALYSLADPTSFVHGELRIKANTSSASASYFTVLGVRPALGRLYGPAEDSLGQGSRVAVVSHRFWRETLGADSSIVGKTVRLGTDPYVVIGVMSPEFKGLELTETDVWVPVAAIPSTHWITRVEGPGPWKGLGPWAFQVILREPATPDPRFEQRASLAVRDANLRKRRRDPDTLMTVATGSIIAARGPGRAVQEATISTRLFGVGAIIYLIAIANVVNLLLFRAAQRRREIAVRLAVGISHGRLVRLLTTETMVLALLAGGAAVLAAWWGGDLLRGLVHPNVEWHESALHWRVTIFALGSAVLAGLVAGVVPALQASRPDLTRALKDGKERSMQRSRLRGTLAIAQAALSVTLLVGAALFILSLKNVEGLRLGFDVHPLVQASVEFETDSAVPTPVVAARMRDIEARLATRPGVQSVARAGFGPLSAFAFRDFYWGADSSRSLRRNFPTYTPVSANYFATVGTRLLRGTTFEDKRGGPGQLVVNDAMAKLLWPGREAIGQCVHFDKRGNPCYTVVGVAENARQQGLIEPEPKPQFYLPIGNPPSGRENPGMFLVRARPEAIAATTAALMTEMRAAFPAGEVTVKSLSDALEWRYRPWRLGAKLFSAFGLLAFVVALVGVYSTVSYGVTQRTHEFGIRIALGARMGDVLRLVVGEGVRVVAVGVLIGVALAIASGKLIASLLYGVEPSDPVVLLAVTGSILAVAAIATLVPAWRAASVDPATALRAE